MTVKADLDTRLGYTLGRITRANGYGTDAGLNVFWELEYTEHPEVMLSLSVYRGELSSGNEGDPPPCCGEVNHFYSFQIEGFIEDTKDKAEGEKLLADLLQALRADNDLGGLAEQIETTKGTVALLQGDVVFSLVNVSFTVFYVTPRGGL